MQHGSDTLDLHGLWSKRTAAILGSLAVLVGVDQLTKVWAIDNLKGQPGQSYLGDLIRIQYAENPGAFLSLGANLSHDSRFWLLSVTVGLFLLGCLGYLIWNRKLHPIATAGLTLIGGGGISNLIDRLFRAQGRVIDFMNMGIGSLRTGIFNVADMVILLGVALLVFWNPAGPTDSEVEPGRKPAEKK